MQLTTLALALASVLLPGGVQAPIPQASNPLATSPRIADTATIQAGGTLFRERCADCHGADAKGVSGPDLTRLWTTVGSDERVFQTIRSGIPGSIMPPSSAPDEELRSIVAYLRSISVAKAEASSGNTARGEMIFAANCASCHRIKGRGGRLGPDLSRLAASQSNRVLTEAIRHASASFTRGFEPVTLITRDGQRIRGTRKGEDPFSIQIMDTNERLEGYLKADLREVIHETQSLMPDFGTDRLSDEDLNDLLAFLGTFRVAEPPRRQTDGPADNRNDR
jgi:putative heme-binding domain-containing protein